MIGLGRMGANMVRRLLRTGHSAVVFDFNPDAVAKLVAEGATGATSIEDFVQKLEAPRTAWIMVPAGDATEKTVATLGGLLSRGDAIIDGGSSFFKDDVRRAQQLAPKGIDYIDVGTSGGVWGLERGYSDDRRARRAVQRGSNRCSRAWRPARARFPIRRSWPTRSTCRRARSRAICTADRLAPDTSSR